MTGSPVVIEMRRSNHPDAVRLLEAFLRDQVERYGYADPVDLDPADFTPPGGAFVVAYLDGAPVSCGGYRRHGAGIVEIKKTYTVPEARGHGVGRRVLSRLEELAVDAGARQAVLETGIRNDAAVAMFRSLGYRPIDGYVPGRDPDINRAFAKRLT
ncbi:N-acetyltransferase [Virgisporangium aliadipatigenens]|uniref:N-acetyltransferase n=1 Tax=Virgisporangium aliadipatigenens TaxID=741659 RepID=A0A8J4DUV1_9ACTN|nr:GNAT family N-acetyltransferase [Virgisporangium aliadipatigenens]GIJ50786.1 N-acetyltransferase [Virgisporangium aliadipatigenens]